MRRHSERPHCLCHFIPHSCRAALVLLQALFQAAWQTAQADLAPPDILIGHRALRISEQLALQARTAMEGENCCCPEGFGAPGFHPLYRIGLQVFFQPGKQTADPITMGLAMSLRERHAGPAIPIILILLLALSLPCDGILRVDARLWPACNPYSLLEAGQLLCRAHGGCGSAPLSSRD